MLRETGAAWWSHDPTRLAAALSYYIVFSLTPILLVVVAVAGLVSGSGDIHGRIIDQARVSLGRDGVSTLATLLHASSGRRSGALATAAGLAVMLLGATSVMIELQDSLNTIWNVAPAPGLQVKILLRDRLVSLGLVLGFGFVLLLSLIASAALTTNNHWMEGIVPYRIQAGLLISEVFSFGIIALLLALIFRVLPSARTSWRDVWIGALFTSALLAGGKVLIGIYIRKASIASAYGAAGSLAALMIWVYYSSLIILLGAEFTRGYASRFGSAAAAVGHGECNGSTR